MTVAIAIALTGMAHMIGDYLIQSHWMAKVTPCRNAGHQCLVLVLAHYLLSIGYPSDRPDHLRSIAERQADRMQARRPA